MTEYRTDVVTLVQWSRESADAPWKPVREDMTTRIEGFSHAVTLTTHLSERHGLGSRSPSSLNFHAPLKEDNAGRAELAARIRRLAEVYVTTPNDELWMALERYGRVLEGRT